MKICLKKPNVPPFYPLILVGNLSSIVTETKYFVSYKVAEVKFGVTRIAADVLYMTDVVSAYCEYIAAMNDWNTLYLAALAHADDPNFMLAGWFNGGGKQGDFTFVTLRTTGEGSTSETNDEFLRKSVERDQRFKEALNSFQFYDIRVVQEGNKYIVKWFIETKPATFFSAPEYQKVPLGEVMPQETLNPAPFGKRNRIPDGRKNWLMQPNVQDNILDVVEGKLDAKYNFLIDDDFKALQKWISDQPSVTYGFPWSAKSDDNLHGTIQSPFSIRKVIPNSAKTFDIRPPVSSIIASGMASFTNGAPTHYLTANAINAFDIKNIIQGSSIWAAESDEGYNRGFPSIRDPKVNPATGNMAGYTQRADDIGSAKNAAGLKALEVLLNVSSASRTAIKAYGFTLASRSYLVFTLEENGEEELIYFGTPEGMTLFTPDVNIINGQDILKWLKVDLNKVINPK